ELDAAVAHQHHELDHIDHEEADEIAGADARADAEGRPHNAVGERVEVEFPTPKGLRDDNHSESDKSE
ncbi:hypothetical protein ABTJ50_22455, partial [Acinetobacter baumannii]